MRVPRNWLGWLFTEAPALRGNQTRLRLGRRTSRRRRGMILFIVLIVVALLTLAAYTYASLMVAYRSGARISGRQLQARVLVESGADAVRFYLMQDEAGRQEAGGAFDNPLYFQAIPLLQSQLLVDRASFSVLSPNIDEQGNLGGVRYGLENESTRLNLNSLLLVDKVQEGAARDLLMGLPQMTEDVADAILDWIDSDDEPREYGAESEYYMMIDPPYMPKNGPLATVEELLLVRGVTPQLLFGVDTNRNGMVDPHESYNLMLPGATMTSGPTTSSGNTEDAEPLNGGREISGGSMDRGWSGYLTLWSAEKNTTLDGSPRIDLNMDDMQQLYDSLAEQLNEDWARFIVAYRQYGAYDGDEKGEDVGAMGDLDPSKSGKTKLTQVLDLIGKKVQIPGSDGEDPITIAPVFSDSLAEMGLYLPVLMDNVTINPETVIPGRVNVNLAPLAILRGIPGVEDEVADEIISQRMAAADESTDGSAPRHETWLLTSGIVTLDQMKKLMPLVTAGGDVFRAQIVGYYEDGGVSARAEIVFDATGSVPRIVSWKDISHLGRGYPLELLGFQNSTDVMGQGGVPGG